MPCWKTFMFPGRFLMSIVSYWRPLKAYFLKLWFYAMALFLLIAHNGNHVLGLWACTKLWLFFLESVMKVRNISGDDQVQISVPIIPSGSQWLHLPLPTPYFWEVEQNCCAFWNAWAGTCFHQVSGSSRTTGPLCHIICTHYFPNGNWQVLLTGMLVLN